MRILFWNTFKGFRGLKPIVSQGMLFYCYPYFIEFCYQH